MDDDLYGRLVRDLDDEHEKWVKRGGKKSGGRR